MNTVCVYNAPDHLTALRAKELIEASGIICMMPNEHHSQLQPYMNLAIGGFRLYVAEPWAAQARSALRENGFVPENSEDVDGTPPASPHPSGRCPACGSDRFHAESRPRGFSILTLFILFGVPTDLRKHYLMCDGCGYRFKRPAEPGKIPTGGDANHE
jgi:hypothetical protein